jgi:hypothetical protein
VRTTLLLYNKPIIVGFFDKTPSSSGKRRTRGKRIETPGSAKSDVQGETPGGKVLRKSQRFGRLNVQPKSSRAPKQGYQSNDGKSYCFKYSVSLKKKQGLETMLLSGKETKQETFFSNYII